MKTFEQFIKEGKSFNFDATEFHEISIDINEKSGELVNICFGNNNDTKHPFANIQLSLKNKGEIYILESEFNLNSGNSADSWIENDDHTLAQLKFNSLEELKRSKIVDQLIRFLEGDTALYILGKNFKFKFKSATVFEVEINDNKLSWPDKTKMSKLLSTEMKGKNAKKAIELLKKI